MAIVYQHIRKDTNEVFYVGIGKNEKRPYSLLNRNKHWRHIAKKAGYYVEIIYPDLQWELACNMEQYLIESYGRIDLGNGCLVNMTNGGEGVLGYKFTENQRKKISEKVKGNKNMLGKKHSEETRQKQSEAHKGKKLSEEHKRKIKESSRISVYNAKKVINTETGEIYISAADCARKTGYKKLREKLRGLRKNNTPFQYMV
jgi:hypothetical protein